MAPEAAEPFHVALHHGIGGQEPQGIGDLGAAHLLQSPEQGARIVEHDSGAAPLADQRRKDVGEPAVAVREGLRVVVIALCRVIQHVLEVGDEGALRPGRDCRLVHVQRAGEA